MNGPADLFRRVSGEAGAMNTMEVYKSNRDCENGIEIELCGKAGVAAMVLISLAGVRAHLSGVQSYGTNRAIS